MTKPDPTIEVAQRQLLEMPTDTDHGHGSNNIDAPGQMVPHTAGMTRVCHRSAAGAALVLALSSCSGDTGADASDPAPTVTVTATVTASPDEAEPEPETDEPAAVGDEQPTPWGAITVLEFNPQVTSDPSAQQSVDQPRWAGVLARTCVADGWDGEAVMPSWTPWSLTDQDGGIYLETGISGGVSYPQPVYPQLGDRTTRPGSCTQGWIVFSAAPGAKIAEVAYEGQGLDAPLVWSLS